MPSDVVLLTTRDVSTRPIETVCRDVLGLLDDVGVLRREEVLPALVSIAMMPTLRITQRDADGVVDALTRHGDNART